MKIFLLGSGGREHALAWKICQSPLVEQLWVAPGNAGTARLAASDCRSDAPHFAPCTNVDMRADDFDAVKALVLREHIDMLVVGPEDPLVKGVADVFRSDEQLAHVLVVGPSKAGAMLEGSKEFAKQFMSKHHIPTAAYRAFTPDTLDEGLAFLASLQPPYVLKADGLCAGKGVLILPTLEEAQRELRAMLDGMFGSASSTVVVEEFLSGRECSVFVLTDGRDYRLLPVARDYKRAGDGDTGLNTGGMGSVSPVSFADAEFMRKVEERIVRPTVEGLAAEGIDYHGFIFLGLIRVDRDYTNAKAGDPMVIEYNVRMGDPETETVMLRLKSDIVPLLEATARGSLGTTTVEEDSRSAVCVMLVSGGYPEAYGKGFRMSGLDAVSDAVLFHAGTALKGDDVVTNGGRVLAVSAYGDSQEQARARAYEEVAKIDFQDARYRHDIAATS